MATNNNGKGIAKFLALFAGVAAANVILFSPSLLGIVLGASALATAGGVTAIFMSAGVLYFGCTSFLFQKKSVRLLKPTELSEPNDYREALRKQNDKKFFAKTLERCQTQIDSMENKSTTLSTVLNGYFGEGITVSKFNNTIYSSRAAFYTNIKNILNRIIVFDEEAYNRAVMASNNGIGAEMAVANERLRIFNEHLKYIDLLIGCNAEILLKFDSLLLEITKLDSADGSDLQSLPALTELAELIEQTKLYK